MVPVPPLAIAEMLPLLKPLQVGSTIIGGPKGSAFAPAGTVKDAVMEHPLLSVIVTVYEVPADKPPIESPVARFDQLKMYGGVPPPPVTIIAPPAEQVAESKIAVSVRGG